MLAYEAATAWNREIPCNFFKTVIQLYLLRSFLYSLTYCIKEGIKDSNFEIKWKKCQSMRQLRPETGEFLVFSFKALIQVYLLRSFIYSLTYYIKEVIIRRIFWRWNNIVLAYEAATAWNRGIVWKKSKTVIQLYLFFYFSIFDLLYQRGYQRQYFWILNL